MVGLSNVNNTTDLSKPISDATTAALNLKAAKASPTFTGTVAPSALTTTGLITAGYGIKFNSGSGLDNIITKVYQTIFDNSYGLEKIILYDGGSSVLNYSLGVNANTLFYSSPYNHNFYIGARQLQLYYQ